MSNKNAVRTTLAGLGVAGGAAVVAALTSVATASADDDIDGHPFGWNTSITTSASGPAIDIFNNRGHGLTDIYGTAPNAYDHVTIYDNSYGAQVITNIDGTGTGAQNVVDINNNGEFNGVSTILTHIWGGGGPGSENLVDIDNNIGTTQTFITDTATDAAPVSVSVNDNIGEAGIQVNDPSGGDITFAGNSNIDGLSLLGQSGSYTITVESQSVGEPLTISDASDLSAVYVGVDAGTLGTVTANIDGVTTVVPAGDEFEFVNGTIAVISTTF